MSGTYKKFGLYLGLLLFVFVVASCGRCKKQAKDKTEVKQEESTTIAIEQGSENKAKEDSIKRAKNELKKLPLK